MRNWCLRSESFRRFFPLAVAGHAGDADDLSASDLEVDPFHRLEAAIAGETHEYTDMYPGMAATARDEGFDEIADWFETLAKAERSHANRFQKALDAMG
mgnify:CR=1 FL=1